MIDLDSEIENWARLVRVGRIRHNCGSVEGGFRAPAAENLLTNETSDPPRPPLRVLDGWMVERAWRSLPEFRVRMLVAVHYIRNRALHEAARKAKVPHHQAEFLLNQARLAMKRRLLQSEIR